VFLVSKIQTIIIMKQGGVHKLVGTIDGLNYYERDGQYFVRKATGFTAEEIKNNPDLVRIKENNQEFTASAMAAKGMRLGMAIPLKLYGDGEANPRMMSLFRGMINRSTAVRGQRPILPLLNKDLILGLVLWEGHTLEEVLLAPCSVATNAGRNQTTLTVPDFDTRMMVNAPPSATHFRLVCSCTVLSAYTYDVATKQYVASDVVNVGKNAYTTSGYLPLGGIVGAVTTVVASITPVPTLAATSALVACVGIEFYQDLGGTKYLLGNNTMRVKEVF
jgi:hypothetical protein